MAKQASYGEWAFIAGVILAVILGLVEGFGYILPVYTATILVVLGLLVGFLNITGKETHVFLLASIALLLVSSAGLGSLPFVGTYLSGILVNIGVFVAPAALVVALKAVYELAGKR